MNSAGVYTGRWGDLVRSSERASAPKSSRHLLRTMGENPAFEWNAKDAGGGGGEGGPDPVADRDPPVVVVVPCLDRFDLQVTLAPAVVLESRRKKRNGAKSR